MSTSFPATNALVVQHNALVNSQFNINTHETRLFLALLSRVQRDDTAFSKCQFTVRELIGQTGSNNVYDQVRRMVKELASRTLTIEKLSPEGRRLNKSSFTVIPLLAFATYVEGEGMVEAQFNEQLLPYLLDLRDNFTKAQLVELSKIKSASSYRIYWLLREYIAFGKRTIKLTELKAILGLDKEYDRFNNFRARVLERAKQELAETDLPFTYETIKEGREVKAIKFYFESNAQNTAVELVDSPSWERQLRTIGVNASGVEEVKTRLAAGVYDEKYVNYVLIRTRSKVVSGEVRREAGAVFKALTEGYWLEDYRKEQQAPRPRKTETTAYKKARAKLENSLDDAQKSVLFFQTLQTDDEEGRKKSLVAAQAEVVRYETELKKLGGKPS